MPSRCLNCIYRAAKTNNSIPCAKHPLRLRTHNRVTKDFGLGAVKGQPALFPRSSRAFRVIRPALSGLGEIRGHEKTR